VRGDPIGEGCARQGSVTALSQDQKEEMSKFISLEVFLEGPGANHPIGGPCAPEQLSKSVFRDMPSPGGAE